MTETKIPAPRANAGNRAHSKTKHPQHKPSPGDWEAQAAADWLASHFSIPGPLARVLGALTAIAGAFK